MMAEKVIPVSTETVFVNSTAAMESSPTDISGAFVGTSVPRASPNPQPSATDTLAVSTERAC